jgi:hypothetical protein
LQLINNLVAEQRGQPVAGNGAGGAKSSVGGNSAGHNVVASLGGDGGVDSAADLGLQGGDDSGNQIRLVDGGRGLAGGDGGLSVVVDGVPVGGSGKGGRSGGSGTDRGGSSLAADGDSAFLFVHSLCVSHGASLVVDSDQGSSGINIGVGTGNIIAVTGLVVGDVGLLIIISNLEFIGVVGAGGNLLLELGGLAVAGDEGFGSRVGGGGTEVESAQSVGNSLSDGRLQGAHNTK